MVLTADNIEVNRSYQVLFYKRTNKVHKSKGVAKFDGSLRVAPPPSCVVQLREDDGAKNPIFSGIQRDITRRAFGINESPKLQPDDLVVLGQYECQIVNILSSATHHTTSTFSSNTESNPIQVRRPMMPLQSKKRPLVAQNCSTMTTSTTSVKTVASKPDWQETRIPPPQPKRSADDSSSDDDNDPVPTRPVMPKNPLLTKRRKVTTVASSTASSNATTSFQFPGAIGKVIVPPSICRILRPHQAEGVAFLWNCLTGASPELRQATAESGVDPVAGVILADEMGLGKTLMTIATLFALHRRQKDKRFIVVCPSSLVSNWAKEFDKWIGKASQPKRVVVRKGGEQGLQTIRAFVPIKPHQAEVLIISYELFRMNANLLTQAKQVGLLVVDEGHRLKNSAGSLTLTALNGLQCDARLLITGTPIQNNLTEFYTVANFVCPGLLGDLESFRRVYERPISAANSKSAKWEQRARGHAQSQTLDKITKTFMLRRLQKDILKSLLPPRKELLLFCRPSECQRELYKRIAGSAMSSLGATTDALTVLTNLRKLCCHPSLLEKNNQGANDVALSGKLKVLDALLQATKQCNPDDKVVIVSNFTSVLSTIEETIFKARKWPYVRLDGTVAQSDRQPLVDSFNRCSPDKAFAFLLSSKAGGCGLNLIGANRLVMFDADFNPATDMQAMARIYRQGQTKPCFVYRMFTSGTVEEVVYQRQVQKGNLAKITVDRSSSAESFSAKFTKEELRDCFTLKEDCDCDTKRKVGKRWLEYGGAEGLTAQGCNDASLLSVANDQSETLSFVHVVTEEELVVPESEDTSEQTEDASEQKARLSSDEECEFVDNENNSNDDETHGLSEEEYEFDE